MDRLVITAGVLAVAAAGELWWMVRRRERAMRAAEQAYDGSFNLAIERPQLDEFVRLLSPLVTPAALQSAAVTDAPNLLTGHRDGNAIARSAVDFAVARFGLEVPPVAVSFASDLPAGQAGAVVWDAPWDFVISEDLVTIVPVPGRTANWRIRLYVGLQADPARLLAVAAHEVAHLILLTRRIGLQPAAENERLTDAFAVLAGFGPLMERTAYLVRQDPWTAGPKLRWSVQTSLYLHRAAIQYLHGCRAQLITAAGGPASMDSERTVDNPAGVT